MQQACFFQVLNKMVCILFRELNGAAHFFDMRDKGLGRSDEPKQFF